MRPIFGPNVPPLIRPSGRSGRRVCQKEEGVSRPGVLAGLAVILSGRVSMGPPYFMIRLTFRHLGRIGPHVSQKGAMFPGRAEMCSGPTVFSLGGAPTRSLF